MAGSRLEMSIVLRAAVDGPCRRSHRTCGGAGRRAGHRGAGTDPIFGTSHAIPALQEEAAERIAGLVLAGQ